MQTASKRNLKILGSSLTILVIVMILTLLYLYYHDFAVVIPDQVYRSRELSKQKFEKIIQQYHIKSVLNLRGSHPGLKWYDQEMQAMHKDNINHYNIALSSKKLPSIKTFNKLVTILQTAPRPILIHCESGVDRTGLGAVISLILANEKSMTKIKNQVSWKHFVLSDKSVGIQVLHLYNAWLKKNNLTTSKETFLVWVRQINQHQRY